MFFCCFFFVKLTLWLLPSCMQLLLITRRSTLACLEKIFINLHCWFTLLVESNPMCKLSMLANPCVEILSRCILHKNMAARSHSGGVWAFEVERFHNIVKNNSQRVLQVVRWTFPETHCFYYCILSHTENTKQGFMLLRTAGSNF